MPSVFTKQAIRSARENGFVHNEALANELAARFYAARGFETISQAYLRNARYGYLRWGADGKVRQLDQLYPHLRTEEAAAAPTGTIGAPLEQLDLATVIKVSQAVSGEMVLEKLLDTLMRTAIEHAGAERALLMLSRGDEQRIVAEATTSSDTVVVQLRDEPVTASMLPETVLRYVLHTQESVILDDAAIAESLFHGSVYPPAPRSFSALPAALEPGQTHRSALPREQPRAARLRAGAHRGAEAARLSSGDLAREYPVVSRPRRTRARIAHDRGLHSRPGCHVDADRRGGSGQRTGPRGTAAERWRS